MGKQQVQEPVPFIRTTRRQVANVVHAKDENNIQSTSCIRTRHHSLNVRFSPPSLVAVGKHVRPPRNPSTSLYPYPEESPYPTRWLACIAVGKHVRLPREKYTSHFGKHRKIRQVDAVGMADPVSIGQPAAKRRAHPQRGPCDALEPKEGVRVGKRWCRWRWNTCSTPWSKWRADPATPSVVYW